MDCTDLNALLSGFVDDEIAPERRHDAERHLVGCTTCRSLVDRAETLDSEMRSTASRWSTQGVFSERSIRAVLDRTVGDPFLLRRARRLAGMGWLAAAAALAVAVTAWSTRPGVVPERNRALTVEKASRPAGASTTLAASDSPNAHKLPASTGCANAPNAPNATDAKELPDPSTPSAGCSAPDGRDSAVAALMGPPSCLALVDEHGAALCDGRKERDSHERRLDPMTPELAAEASQVLFASALLLSRVADASVVGFDAERDPVATIVEYDALADRLGQIRCHLRRGVDRAAVWATEAMLLRLRERPLDDAERQEMREDIIRMRLIEILDATSRRIDSLPRA